MTEPHPSAASPPAEALAAHSTPVVCDQCAARGLAGDPAFAGIPDILDFTPVPRRAHANGWTDAHQRAFIAALALTGSAGQAARTIGRHAYGAERLRTARGGRGFARAWEAALDIARQRELARVHANLSDLARAVDDRDATAPPGFAAPSNWGPDGWGPDEDDDGAAEREHRERMDAIRDRLMRARRLYLRSICADPAKRAAWEELVGPTDWDLAERIAPQPDEPPPGHSPSMLKPDMLLPVEAGLLADVVGGPDALAEIRAEIAALHGEPKQLPEPGT